MKTALPLAFVLASCASAPESPAPPESPTLALSPGAPASPAPTHAAAWPAEAPLEASARPLRFTRVFPIDGKAFMTVVGAPARAPKSLASLAAPNATVGLAHLTGYPAWLLDPKPHTGTEVAVLGDVPCSSKPTKSFLFAVMPVEWLKPEGSKPAPVDLEKSPLSWREIVELAGCKTATETVAVHGQFRSVARHKATAAPGSLEREAQAVVEPWLAQGPYAELVPQLAAQPFTLAVADGRGTAFVHLVSETSGEGRSLLVVVQGGKVVASRQNLAVADSFGVDGRTLMLAVEGRAAPMIVELDQGRWKRVGEVEDAEPAIP